MKEKIKFLTRLKKEFMAIVLLLACLSALANEPLSISITGPAKIFTNDKVKYTASLVGANANACVWTVTGGGSGTPTGRTYQFNAPGSESTVTISCSVSVGEGDNKRTAEDSITVTVVVPQITLCRHSLDLDGQCSTNIINITNDTDTAFIRRNGMRLPEEALALSIVIEPTDVDIQSFEITTSSTSSLNLYKNNSKLTLPYHPSNISKVSALNAELNGLCVWGAKCGKGLKVKLKINDNQKISLEYDVYGIGNNAFTFPSLEIANACREKCPDLINNEWAYETPSNTLLYNCLAYAIKKPPIVNTNKYFWCQKTLGNVTGYAYADKFINRSGYNSYFTSVDTFGNKNGVFEESDVDAYFKHSFWGSDRAKTVRNGPFPAGNIPHGDIFYYNGFHAARRSVRNGGAYPSWHMLESKCGDGVIIIHRLKQLCGNFYGNISKVYYR